MSAGAGWFVLNVRDAHWNSRPGPQMYHWETETEHVIVGAGDGPSVILDADVAGAGSARVEADAIPRRLAPGLKR